MSKLISKEAKRQEVMDAALSLFLEKGFKSVTTREITEKAGISKGSLYDYFENKDDLFYQTIHEGMSKKLVHKTVMDVNLSSEEKFMKLSEIPLKSPEIRKQRLFLMFDFYMNCQDNQKINEIIGNIYNVAHSYVNRTITGAFPELKEDEEKAVLYANIFIAFMDGVVLQHLFDPERAKSTETVELFWEIMFDKLKSLSK
ncbi:TetR/AcrR family transcriptional regulator [candidate division KSB1 bacterium]